MVSFGRKRPSRIALRERVLDFRLDRALEGARAVDRVEADLGELAHRGVRDLEAEVHLREALLQRGELDARDLLDVLLAERVEHHHLVDAVHELGPELVLHLGHHRELHHLVVASGHALDHLRAEVGGHDEHGVLEVDRAPLAVGEAPFVEHLQQHVEHVGVRLLDLVEQDHRVGLASHLLGELPALLVADIARRRADQPRDRVLLHVLGHVDADEVVDRVEQELGERLRQLGFARRL